MSTKRIGIVFPGYGQQFIGMGKDLYDELRIIQEFFEQAAGSADVNFVKLLFASSAEEISSIRYGYLAIYLFEVSLYQLLYDKGVRPDFVAGHGIGEYSAAYATRSLSFMDGLYILRKYSEFYDEFIKTHPYSALRIVREFDLPFLKELCASMSTEDEKIFVSAQNTQHAFYVAGHETKIEALRQYCVEKVIRKVRVIGPEYGMHSALVNELVDQLRLYYHKIKFNELQVPLITNVDGVYVTTPDALESALMRKINNPVEWYEVIQGFSGCDVIVSVGPGDQLIEWFKEVYPDKEYHVVATLKDVEILQESLQLTAKEQSQETVQDNVVSSGPQYPDIDSSQEGKTLYDADLINEDPADFDVDDDQEDE